MDRKFLAAKCWRSCTGLRKPSHIPVTADVEAGTGRSLRMRLKRATGDCGRAVGMNLEDAIPTKPDALADLNLQ